MFKCWNLLCFSIERHGASSRWARPWLPRWVRPGGTRTHIVFYAFQSAFFAIVITVIFISGFGAGNIYLSSPASSACIFILIILKHVILLKIYLHHFLFYHIMYCISISNYVILNQCLLQLCWITFYFKSVQKMLLLNIIKDSIILSLWR